MPPVQRITALQSNIPDTAEVLTAFFAPPFAVGTLFFFFEGFAVFSQVICL